MYVIIYSVFILTLYTLILYLGVRKSIKEVKEQLGYLKNVVSVVEELKNLIIPEEEILMLEDKGANKNTRTSETMVAAGPRPVVNRLSLTDLVTTKPTDENYEEVMDLLAEVAQHTYSDYKFFIARSQDETTDPNFIQIVSHSSELPGLHKRIFAKSVNYGLEMPELQKRFAARIARNEVIDLGEGIEVILNDGTEVPPTGVSPINKGLDGGEIAFIITFIQKGNLDKWIENTFPAQEDEANG